MININSWSVQSIAIIQKINNMSTGFYNVPIPVNEPIKSYAPGSTERLELKLKIQELRAKKVDLPMIIDGKEVRSGKKVEMFPPHDLAHKLGCYHQGDKTHVQQAIEAALKAKSEWANTPWQHRAALFLKAADLIAGPYRSKINAATMLGQSKNAYQSEIDAACELADFYRFGVKCMTEI